MGDKIVEYSKELTRIGMFKEAGDFIQYVGEKIS